MGKFCLVCGLYFKKGSKVKMKGCCLECLRFENLSEYGLCRKCEGDMIEKGMEVSKDDEVRDEGDLVYGFGVFNVRVDRKDV